MDTAKELNAIADAIDLAGRVNTETRRRMDRLRVDLLGEYNTRFTLPASQVGDHKPTALHIDTESLDAAQVNQRGALRSVLGLIGRSMSGRANTTTLAEDFRTAARVWRDAFGDPPRSTRSIEIMGEACRWVDEHGEVVSYYRRRLKAVAQELCQWGNKPELLLEADRLITSAYGWSRLFERRDTDKRLENIFALMAKRHMGRTDSDAEDVECGDGVVEHHLATEWMPFQSDGDGYSVDGMTADQARTTKTRGRYYAGIIDAIVEALDEPPPVTVEIKERPPVGRRVDDLITIQVVVQRYQVSVRTLRRDLKNKNKNLDVIRRDGESNNAKIYVSEAQVRQLYTLRPKPKA